MTNIKNKEAKEKKKRRMRCKKQLTKGKENDGREESDKTQAKEVKSTSWADQIEEKERRSWMNERKTITRRERAITSKTVKTLDGNTTIAANLRTTTSLQHVWRKEGPYRNTPVRLHQYLRRDIRS
uniref:Stress response protein nst1 n=1 Tax=Lygus hesperus TaxID=30085 RepID=A0A0A9WBM3_LYGHE